MLNPDFRWKGLPLQDLTWDDLAQASEHCQVLMRHPGADADLVGKCLTTLRDIHCETMSRGMDFISDPNNYLRDSRI